MFYVYTGKSLRESGRVVQRHSYNAVLRLMSFLKPQTSLKFCSSDLPLYMLYVHHFGLWRDPMCVHVHEQTLERTHRRYRFRICCSVVCR